MPKLEEIWGDAIQEVARFVASSFPDVEKKDLEQDLWVYILEQSRFDNPDDDGCRTAMYWVARKKASKYRAEHLTLSSQYCYTTDDLKEILLGWPNRLTSDTTDRSLCEHVAVHSDVAWGLSQLSDTYYAAVISRYVLGEETESGSSERRTLNRAIAKLADIINSYSRTGVVGGPTVRKVLSGSQSRHKITENYDQGVG